MAVCGVTWAAHESFCNLEQILFFLIFFPPIVLFILKLFTVLLLSDAVPCQSKSWASRTARTPCASLCPRYGVEKRCSSWPLKTYSLDKALGAEIAPVQKSPDRYNCLPCFRVSHMSSCCLLVIYEDGGDLESMHGIIDISLAAAANLPTFSTFYTVKNSFSTWMNGQGTTWILINIDRNHPPISCSDKTMMMKKGSRESAHTLFYLKNRTLFWWSLPDGRTGIKLFFPNPGNGSCSPGAKRWSATSMSREAAWLLQALKPAEWHFAKPCQPSSGSNVGTSAG